MSTSILFKSSLAGAIALAFISCGAAFSQKTGTIFHANASNPGAAINLQSVLSSSSPTLLFIHSPHCGPCKKMEPKIQRLASTRNDLKIVDMTLDKKSDKRGIGWDSPAARQFDIHSVPYYMIFDSSGKLIAKGDDAETKLNGWLGEAGISLD
jgi:thiol-disulfide isomerase/thioredoxin